MKKKISLVLSIVLMLSTILNLNVFAKTNLPTISKNKPLITYTYNSSEKVYAYTSSNLKTKTGGYIACSTDECKIIEISGKAVNVIYPVSNGTKTAWFSREAFTYRNLANDAADSSFTAQTKATTYKWKGKSSTFGSVAVGDKCYLLRGNENSDWVQIIYPVSKGHKMGWVTGSDYAKLRGIKTEPISTPTPSNTTKSLADVAKAEIGYQGTNKNGKGTGDYTKYGEWIGSNGTQWCASFVSWCVNQAGVSTKVVPKTPDCDTMESRSNSYSKWNKNSLNSIKRNDVIFFAKTSNLSDSNHVGIVTAVNKVKKTITIVEGNTGPYYGPDIVREITYTVDLNSGKITKGYNGYSFCGYISVN